MSKNIFLVAMSLFPKKGDKGDYSIEKENIFEYKNEDGSRIIVKSHYQLEPIPQLLKEKGVQIDTILLLATEEAKKSVMVIQQESVEDLSPVDYYQEWMRKLYSRDGNSDLKCNIIDLEENHPENAIRDTVDILTSYSMEENVNLYVDTHGGFRSTQLVVDAIVNLWKSTNIDLKVYNVYYGEGNKPNYIELDNSLKMFDFVSGINEFINYGRINSLLQVINIEENKALLDPIIEISDGIQWCNIVKFELGLRHLKNYYEKGKNEICDPYLKIFEDRIRADYGELLTNESIDDAAAMVRWCLKKGFFQQALTLVEARIPKTLIEKRHLIQITEIGRKFVEKYPLYKNQSSMTMADLFNGCLNSFPANVNFWKKGNTDNRILFNDIFMSDPYNFQNLTEDVQRVYRQNRRGNRVNLIRKVEKYTTKTLEEDGVIEFVDVEEKAELYVVLLFMHRTLKDIRNSSNHALTRQPYNYIAIERALNYYLDLIDYLTVSRKI